MHSHLNVKQCNPTTANMTAMWNFEVIILSNRINNELMFKTKIRATDKQTLSFVPNSFFIVISCYLFVCLFSKYGYTVSWRMPIHKIIRR